MMMTASPYTEEIYSEETYEEAHLFPNEGVLFLFTMYNSYVYVCTI